MRSFLVLALLVVLVGCDSQVDDSGAGASEITVTEAHLQLVPGGGAVYFEASNTGTVDDRLVAIDVPGVIGVSLHETTATADGVMRMEPRPDGFALPAGDILILAPGGKHGMLPVPPSASVGTLPIVARFAEAGPIQVTAEVIRAGDAM